MKKPEAHERDRKISKSKDGDYNNPLIFSGDLPVVEKLIDFAKSSINQCANCSNMRWFSHGKYAVPNLCVDRVGQTGHYYHVNPENACAQFKRLFFEEKSDKYVVEFNGNRKELMK